MRNISKEHFLGRDLRVKSHGHLIEIPCENSELIAAVTEFFVHLSLEVPEREGASAYLQLRHRSTYVTSEPPAAHGADTKRDRKKRVNDAIRADLVHGRSAEPRDQQRVAAPVVPQDFRVGQKMAPVEVRAVRLRQAVRR